MAADDLTLRKIIREFATLKVAKIYQLDDMRRMQSMPSIGRRLNGMYSDRVVGGHSALTIAKLSCRAKFRFYPLDQSMRI